MKHRPARSLTVSSILLLIVVFASPVVATNGMNMIGYGVRSSGMGGADAAVDSDASGVAGNPAAMGQLADRSAAIGISLLMPKLNVSNESMGLDLDGESQIFPLPYLAYAQRLGAASPWILGLEAYAQGGMGVDFQNFPTGATTTDSFHSKVMFMRLTGAASYQVCDNLTLGLSAIGGYAGMDFSMFPESPGGMDVEGLTSMGFAGRFGMQYKISEALSLGAVYTSQTALNLDGGTATINFGSEQGGKVEYDAEMKDFTWPQEAEFGVALRPAPALLIAVDAKWIDWSAAMGVVELVVSNPPAGFPATPFPDGQGGYTDTMGFQMNWEDQMVYALGLEYSINEANTLRAGYNYGKSPVPDDNLSPLFPAIIEQHATFGYGLDLGDWGFELAYEHAFENSQTNDNTDPMVNPFGPGITVSHSQNTIHFQTSCSF